MATSHNKVTPQALKKGDLIAFVSPSNRLNNLFSTRVARAKGYLETIGFRVTEIFNSSLSPDFLSSINQRCDELHIAFANPEIKAIICTIGGMSANELLRHLDYDLIRANPKIFVGFSDITILHHALYTKSNLRTFYGPAIIPQFGEFPRPQPFTSEHFFNTLMKPEPATVPHSQEWVPEWVDWMSEESCAKARRTAPSPPWKWLRPGTARGVLFGGCLPSIVQLTGTQYLPDYKGKILLLETPDGMGGPNAPFPVDYVRCALSDLRNAGVLEKVAGMVLGRPFMYDEQMHTAFEKVVLDACYGTEFPILSGVDVGHTDPVLTLPLGCLVALHSERDEFTLEEGAVQ